MALRCCSYGRFWSVRKWEICVFTYRNMPCSRTLKLSACCDKSSQHDQTSSINQGGRVVVENLEKDESKNMLAAVCNLFVSKNGPRNALEFHFPGLNFDQAMHHFTTKLSEAQAPSHLYWNMDKVVNNLAHPNILIPYFLSSVKVKMGLSDKEQNLLKQFLTASPPENRFLKARNMKRHFIYHAGPTNSGKTHHALQRFLQAKTGVYLGPLRLLACEVFQKCHKANVPCDLITGEDIIQLSTSPSNHQASTVEILDFENTYQCAVIDECQMLEDPSRGWAWTDAILGVAAEEVHLCGEERAISVVQKLLASTGDTLKVLKYDRLTPLIFEDSPFAMGSIRKGDCLIVFNIKLLLEMKKSIETRRNMKVACIFGTLPPFNKLKQAQMFNSGEADVLLSTDAIGMGLNLNIHRVIFDSAVKYNGTYMEKLSSSAVKQIAGRAGRFNTDFKQGFVAGTGPNHQIIKELLFCPVKPIKRFYLKPNISQLSYIASVLPNVFLSDILCLIEKLYSQSPTSHSLLPKNNQIFTKVEDSLEQYCLPDLRMDKFNASVIDDLPLSMKQMQTLSVCPIDVGLVMDGTYRKLAELFADGGTISYKQVEQLLKKITNGTFVIEKSLQHDLLGAYMWLSNRFPETFLDTVDVVQKQVALEDDIGIAFKTGVSTSKFKQVLGTQPRTNK